MSNWVAVADNDLTNLKTIGQILSRQNIDITALDSGSALLDFLKTNTPDLILLSITLPDIDSFEIIRQLKHLPDGREPIPVILMTTQNDLDKEDEGLSLGAADVIRRPYTSDLVLNRIQNFLHLQESVRKYERDVMLDSMTGFLNKNASEEKMEAMCSRESGYLCMLDLDVFKLVNDFYGHDVGDQVLSLFARLIRSRLRSNDVCGRIGGDEFILFIRNMHSDDDLHELVKRINEEYVTEFRKLVGDPVQIPLGVSVGAVSVPEMGRDYNTLFRFADRALYTIKQNGKHGCSIYGQKHQVGSSLFREMDLEATTAILEERNVSPNAMWMGEDAFISIYRYMVRYMERYHGVAFRVLFTVDIDAEVCSEWERAEIIMQFRNRVQRSLRNSDVMMEVGDNKLFLLLPAAKDYDVEKVIGRLMENWHQTPYSEKTVITYETGHVQLNRHMKSHRDQHPSDWVALVGSSENTGNFADILRRQNMLVSTFETFDDLMEFLKTNLPNLILLDTRSIDSDIAGVLRGLKKSISGEGTLPVVLLTDQEEQETQIIGMQWDALDFIRRPATPEGFALHICRALELAYYRRNFPD